MAIGFDLDRLEISGTPVSGVAAPGDQTIGGGDFDVADDGTLVYVDAPLAPRDGSHAGVGGSAGPGGAAVGIVAPARLPPATRVARWDAGGGRDRTTRRTISGCGMSHAEQLRQLTSGLATDFFPVWTTDLRRLDLLAGQGGGLFWQAADGTGRGRGPQPAIGPGNAAIRRDAGRHAGAVLAEVPWMSWRWHSTDRRVEPLVQTPFNERNGVVSPDGHWLAYESDSVTDDSRSTSRRILT